MTSTSSSTKPPVSLEGQIFWRELAYLIGFSTPNFHKMVGNPICRQIPWLEGENAKELLRKWEQSLTGYPAVDAAMSQLRTEGWLHHLARHLVACFLTRGDLWVSWELGRDVYLVDADWSINNFFWHWLSCSAFFHQYWPDKYIYEPWMAPSDVQKAAGCIVGKDYPGRIVDHAKVSKVNMEKMKKAYAASKADNEGPPGKKAKKN